MADKVKVAVRVRPMNRRELDLGTRVVVDMEPQQTILHHPSDPIGHPTERGKGESPHRKDPKTFAFDHCFWSMDESVKDKFDGQEKVFDKLGNGVLQKAIEGYNACIFAYGQTGSGKSYTMMGSLADKGLIPRLCDAMFEHISKSEGPDLSCKVEVSYMEIYNEKVHDLLDPKGSKQNLKVREHNILGPYVDGLSNLVVACYDEIENLMSEGNKSRTVAATNMNSESSRSHAVFNIKLTQTLTDTQSGVSGEKVSKISLVDLAGSERAQKTGAVGDRLREGSNINKSLTTLGLVISHLADQAAGKNKNKFVPYRDSVLTWLLKDNLGGNSKTVMVATISPAADNYEETLSTLRYADRAKRIVNHAVVNEDPNARIIRELREEVETLRHQLQEAESLKAPDLKDRLEESEKLMKEMSKTWEEKLQETERIHSERHAALEKMGISVQTSGIKVEQGTYFLVNLNADPCLNELLVYYLKESHTRIGRPDAPVEQDIQLSGLGILSEHCVVDIENADVFVTPMEDARTCVNGSVINTKTRVKHGDRILWGNNHFFRINCPRKGSPMTAEPEQKVDYDFAQQELMMQELSNDPIQEVISGIEKQHQEDKEEALAKQKQMYEEQMQTLRKQMMSPGTPSQSLVPNWDLPRLSPISVGHSQVHPKFQQWAQDRDKLFKQGFAKLREEVVKANALIREANTLAIEMGKEVEFSVTLQIPACNLSPNRKSGTFASEPAILVKRKGGTNLVWSMSKFENKIIDMRDMYEDRIENGHPLKDEGSPSKRDKRDPFYESSDNSDLIGVANVFLCCLFSDIKLEYAVPIINQQGEVSGKLHLEISKVNGTTNERSDTCSENSFDEDRGSVDTLDEENNGLSAGRKITVKVNIKQASGLPPLLSNFVFCQYSFWGQHQPTSVAPLVDMDTKRTSCGAAFVFDHEKEFTVRATEEFLEHCSEGALSIEVWGHRSSGYTIGEGGKPMSITHRSLVDRWSELQRKLELWVEIQELNEQGEYQAVEVVPHPEVPAAGVFQLRQGHSRRLKVSVNPVQRSGTLPLICEAITSMATGGVCARSKLQKGLDSYQDEDLNLLRSQWTEALSKRKEYLDEQLHRLNQKEDKSEEDTEREQSLMAQWMSLTEERNAVIDPQPGSGIPGAPADGAAPLNREHHIPVVFLDLNADDMSTKEELLAGANLILPKEHGATFYNLSIVKHGEKETSAVSLWDSSIHDSIHLNRVTPSNERVYIIVKIVVRLSHPAALDVCLRKRICLNVYKKQSITDRLKRRIIKTNDTMQRLLHVQEYPTASGVIYEIVSNIPKASEQLEDRETLARLAASQNVAHTMDGETYIEKYIKGIAAVDNILALDKLRQEVTMKELVAATGRPIRKTSSVPNINNLFKMDAASPAKSLLMQVKAESIQDLSLSTSPSAFSPEYFRARANSIESKKQERQGSRPNFLNLRLNFSSPLLKRSESAPSSVDPYKLPTKLLPSPAVKSVTLKPLKEEHRLQTKPLLNNDSEDEEELAVPLEASPVKRGDADDFQDFETYHSSSSDSTSDATKRDIPHSSTADSLVDIPTKNFASSMTSSGYGSQGVSSQTLSSEDSTSIRSMNIEDNADPESGHEKHERQISHDSPAESGLNANSGGKGVSSDTDSSSTDAANIHLSSSTNTLVSQNVDQAGSLENVDGSLAQEEEEEEFDDNQLFQREPVKVYDDENLELSEQEEPKPNFQDQSEFDIFSEEAMEELERLGSRRMSQGSLDSMGSNNSDTRTPVRPSQLLEANLRDQVKRYSMELEQEVESFQDNHQEEEHLSDSEDAMSVCSFGSRADLNRLHHTPVPSWVKPGVPVNVTSSSGGPTKSGVVHFVGMTDFASGQWVGVELDQPEGKNDGSVKGVRYFKCRKRHGVFVRHDKLIMDKRRSSIKKSSTPNSKIVGNNTGSIERKTSAHAAANSSFMKPTSASKHKAK